MDPVGRQPIGDSGSFTHSPLPRCRPAVRNPHPRAAQWVVLGTPYGYNMGKKSCIRAPATALLQRHTAARLVGARPARVSPGGGHRANRRGGPAGPRGTSAEDGASASPDLPSCESSWHCSSTASPPWPVGSTATVPPPRLDRRLPAILPCHGSGAASGEERVTIACATHWFGRRGATASWVLCGKDGRPDASQVRLLARRCWLPPRRRLTRRRRQQAHLSQRCRPLPALLPPCSAVPPPMRAAASPPRGGAHT